MPAKVSNNAFGTLSAGIDTSVTTLTLDSGQGAKFPALGGSDYFYATLIDVSNNLEIIKVTARATDSFTMVRAQDGTTAKAYAIGDRVELRPTAALFNEKADTSTVTTSLAGKLDYVAPGTSGNVLTSNGTSWTSVTASSTGFVRRVYTAPATWSKPSDMKAIRVAIQAGGGGYNARPTTAYGPSGSGGGGGYGEYTASAASIPTSVSVTAGAGTNSFGALASATGGGQGLTGASAYPTGPSGANGAGGGTSGCQLSIPGSNGIAQGNLAGGGAGFLTVGTELSATQYAQTGYGYGLGSPNAAHPTVAAPNNGIIIVDEFY